MVLEFILTDPDPIQIRQLTLNSHCSDNLYRLGNLFFFFFFLFFGTTTVVGQGLPVPTSEVSLAFSDLLLP